MRLPADSNQGASATGSTRLEWETVPGLSEGSVTSIAQTSDGYFWLGTPKGLLRFDGAHVKAFDGKSMGLRNDSVTATLGDRDGQLWIGSSGGGLSRLVGERFTAFTGKDGLANDSILCLFESNDGTVWIGTEGGLAQFSNGKFREYRRKDGLSDDVVYSISGGRDGRIWVGTKGGLDLFDGGKFSKAGGVTLAGKEVRAVLVDSKGAVWAGTAVDGLFQVARESAARSVAVRSIQSIREDGMGNLWIVTAGSGLVRCSEGRWKTFSGAPKVEAIFEDRQGNLWFGTSSAGLKCLRTTSKQSFSPPFVERLLIDGKEFAPGQRALVSIRSGNIEVQFNAPGTSNPRCFSYKLEGFDKDWHHPVSGRTAEYRNVPHGDYRFRLRASTGGNWIEAPNAVLITLKPRYYQSFAFLLLLGMAGVGLIAGAHRLRVKHLGQREQRLLALVNERTAALRESERQVRRSRDELDIRVQERTLELVRANQALETDLFERRQTERELRLAKEEAIAVGRATSELLANLSYQLRSPVNEIRDLTKARLERAVSPEDSEYLDTVNRSADFLLAVVTEMLDSAQTWDAAKLPAGEGDN